MLYQRGLHADALACYNKCINTPGAFDGEYQLFATVKGIVRVGDETWLTLSLVVPGGNAESTRAWSTIFERGIE